MLMTIFFFDCLSEGASDSDDDDDVEDDEDVINSFFFQENDCVQQKVSFKVAFKHLVVTKRMEQCLVDALLAFFTLLPGYESLDLPKTCQTLLKSPLETPLRVVEPGFYYHFGIASGIMEMLKNKGTSFIQNHQLSLQFNIDGLPIAKSSGRQLWPILCLIQIQTQFLFQLVFIMDTKSQKITMIS